VRLSGSKVALAWLCQFWMRPDVQAPEQESSSAAVDGSCFALAMERGNVEEAFIKYPDADRAKVADWWLSWLDSETANDAMESEVAFAVDLGKRTARRLPTTDGHRDYSSATETEVCCTLDLVSLDPKNARYVDAKTGRQENLGKPEDSGQLLFGALAIAWLTGAIEVRVGYWHPEWGLVEATVDVFDLEAFCSDLMRCIDAVPNSVPNPGEHCWSLYCGAVGVCPATRKATESITTVEPEALDLTTPEAIGHVVEACVLARARANALEAACKEAVGTLGVDSVPLPGGGKWGKKVTTRSSIVAAHPKTAGILSAFLGEHAAEVVKVTTKRSATKEAIKRAAKKADKPQASTLRDIEGALREEGALSEGPSESWSVTKEK
jgi:hypothetical protein